MLVQFYQPEELEAQELDRYLSQGWFRNSVLLHNSRVIGLGSSVHDVLNIRFALENYILRKSLRKLHKRVHEKYRVISQPVEITPEKEYLYRKHTNRFQGFLFESLDHFLFAYSGNSVFNTHEICVYDQDQLIAYSLFDAGKRAMASLLGVYAEDYSKDSLGIFTMVEEITLAAKYGHAYYYPGYVLSNNPDFNYKLRLGTPEYLLPDLTWGSKEELDSYVLPGQLINQKIKEIKAFTTTHKLSGKLLANPFYSMGYGHFGKKKYCKGIKVWHGKKNEEHYLLEYDYEQEHFKVSQVKEDIKSTLLMTMKTTQDIGNREIYLPHICEYKQEMGSSAQLVDLLPLLKELF